MPIATNNVIPKENALLSLRRSWFYLLILQGLLLMAGYQVLLKWWSDQYAVRWFGLATLSSLVFFAILWRRLEFNSRPGEDFLLTDFGPGNLLTIMRGLILALLMGFLFSPWPQGWLAWIPGLLYTIVAIADLFDGYLARNFDHQTSLGEKLDLTLDGWGMLIASILLVQYGQVAAWYLLVGLARYFFVAGIWLRRKLGLPVFELTSNSTRRPFAGAQMGFAAVVLYPLFSPPGTTFAAALFAVPFLVGFVIDWLQVSGGNYFGLLSLSSRFSRMKPSNDLVLQSRENNRKILTYWAPLVFRISLVITLGLWVERNLIGLISRENYTAAISITESISQSLWMGWLLIFIGLGLLMIALGTAGRIAALVVLFGVGIYINNFGLSFTEALLVLGAAITLYSGTGPYSLWSPEQGIVTRRLGEL
jgi:CDP-diacylglycerol--glycerol-3-phosphate 3-phosphatidyltransferase